MGSSCSATPHVHTVAPEDRPAAVKQEPKRYTSRKSVGFLDGTPNPNRLPPKHDQRRPLTEEQEASERCVAALRDGEAAVFGTGDATEPVTPQSLPTLPFLRGDDESQIVRFTDHGSFAECTDEPPASAPLAYTPDATAHKKHGCPRNMSEGVLSVEQRSNASQAQPGSISGWTGSNKTKSGAASPAFTASPGSRTFSPIGDPNFLERLDGSTDVNNSPLLINCDDPLTPQAVAPTNAFDDSGTTSTSSYPSTMCSPSPFRPNERV